MPSESHDSTAKTHAKAWVLYDGDCGICITLIQQCQGIWVCYGFQSVPLQTDWVKEKLGYAEPQYQQELLKEMKVLTQSGQVFGGADAILYIAKTIWWAYPLYLLSFLPGVKTLLRKVYQWIAARRHCSANGCSLPKRK